MARIENIDQLRSEISRLRVVCKEQEVVIKSDLTKLKEELSPANIILNTISGITGIRLNHRVFEQGGFLYGISLLLQRLMIKTEKKAEDTVYHLVDVLFDRIQNFVNRHTSSGAKKEDRKNQE